MVTCEQTMDQKSLAIIRDGKCIGHAMWHREPLIELSWGGWPDGQLKFTEIEAIVSEVKRVRQQRGN